MSRKYRIVAEVEEEQNAPTVGEKIADWGFTRGGAWSGAITEVTPIMTAEEALEEVDKLVGKTFLDHESITKLRDRLWTLVRNYHASQEKP